MRSILRCSRGSTALDLADRPLWLFFLFAGALSAHAQSPAITGFSPSGGPVGTTVVINGTNFIPPLSIGFAGNVDAAGSFTSTMVTVTVPAGAETGPITVTTANGSASTATNFTVGTNSAHPAFFNGEASVGNGVYYLQLFNGAVFGYYSYLTDPSYLYSFDLGYEYLIDANDSLGGIYFYDFTSQSFFYTSPAYPYPYLYDFTLSATLYYYGNGQTSSRSFYNFSTGEIITL